MSQYTKVVLAPRGSQRRSVEAKDIQVPDLWPTIERLGNECKGCPLHVFSSAGRASEAVRTTWHLAANLLEHIVEREDPTAIELLAAEGCVGFTQGDVRVVIAMMQLMYDLLHEEQPECCGVPTELIVETEGRTKNITKDVSLVIEHLKQKLAEVRGEEQS